MEEFHRMPCRTEPGRGSIKTGGTGLKNRAAYFGVFTALALIFSYVESLIRSILVFRGLNWDWRIC